VGGGTDLPAFYRAHGGAVVSTAVDKYVYVTVNTKFDHRIRASYSITEIVDAVKDLKHELIREGLRLLGFEGGVEITTMSDIPSEGTGLGSSSSHTVGLLNALHAYLGHHADGLRLAEEACEIELGRCSKPIGKQDQYIAAFGGLQHIQFNHDDSVYVDPVILTPETKQRLHSHLLLLYTGHTRSANTILYEQTRRMESSPDVVANGMLLKKLAEEFLAELKKGQLDRLGEIMHRAWLAKKQLAPGISNPLIDSWYDRARDHGAIGGKILGAGGGGFLLVWAHPTLHPAIIRALPDLRPVPFGFEAQGSKIVYVEEANSMATRHRIAVRGVDGGV